MASGVKPCRFSPNNDFELHMLTQGGNLWMTIWSLKSFIFHSGLFPKIIIHDDGSIDGRTIRILKEKFSGLEVISREKADGLILNRSDLSDKVKKMRRTKNNLLLKLIDIPLLSCGRKIMITGDDLFYFSKPKEIIDFVSGEISNYSVLASKNDGNYDMGVKEEYLERYKLKDKKADFINSDLLLFDEGCITPASINEYFENSIMDENFYFLEMAGLSCILAQSNFSFLPIDTYHIKGPVSEKTVMKHFTSPRRQEFFAYGIDLARKILESQSNASN